MKTVLFVSGNDALWIGIIKGKIVDSVEEQIVTVAQRDVLACSWLQPSKSTVSLILDCEQTEIDAHPLANAGMPWSYGSNKKALQQRLIEQFPEAIIRTGSKGDQLSAALAHHVNLSALQSQWLSQLLDQGVVFNSMTTSAELLAVVLVKEYPQRCLVVSATSSGLRHTFCHSGHALFTRSVVQSDGETVSEQLEQTLQHLSNTELIDQALPVCLLGVDRGLAHLFESIALVSSVGILDIAAERRQLEIEDYQSFSARRAMKFQLALKMIKAKTVNRTHVNRKTQFLLGAWVRKNREARNRWQSVGVCILLLSSFTYVGVGKWNEGKLQKSLMNHKAQINNEISQIQTKAQAISKQAKIVSTVLFDINHIESLSGVNPAVLMQVLSSAFTRFRTLELMSVQWDVIDDVGDSSMSFNSDANAGVVSSRRLMLSKPAAPSKTQIQLSGRMLGGASMREQMSSFNSFVAYLEQQDGLSEMKVVKAPLMEGGGLSFQGDVGSERLPEFAIQFELNRLEGSGA